MNLFDLIKQKLEELFYPPQRFIRYIVCGCGAAAINYTSFLLICTVFKLHFSLSMFLAVVITWIYSFFANKFFVFQSKKQKNLREFLLFIAQQSFLFVCSVGLMWFMISGLGVHEAVSWLLVSGIILFFNYAGMSFIIWRKNNTGTI